MAMYTWTFDAPDGVYKNHAMSSDIREAAIAETKFMQFVTAESGYGRKSGEAVTINRISNIDVPADGRLLETERIPEDELTITSIQINVSEWGRSVPYTNLADELSSLDLENVIQRKLKDQMKLVLDTACAAAFKTAKIKAIPDSATSIVFDTDGTPSTQATVNLNFFHIEQIRDYMFSVLNVPTFSGDDYIGLVSTKAKRGIMSDPAFETWNKYTNPEAKYNSEIGRLENIRFIEVNNAATLSGSKGLNGVLGEAIIFGADAIAMAVVQDPELRAKMPSDYGRSKGVAWYGIMDFGLIWDTANPGEARVIHVTSS